MGFARSFEAQLCSHSLLVWRIYFLMARPAWWAVAEPGVLGVLGLLLLTEEFVDIFIVLFYFVLDDFIISNTLMSMVAALNLTIGIAMIILPCLRNWQRFVRASRASSCLWGMLDVLFRCSSFPVLAGKWATLAQFWLHLWRSGFLSSTTKLVEVHIVSLSFMLGQFIIFYQMLTILAALWALHKSRFLAISWSYWRWRPSPSQNLIYIFCWLWFDRYFCFLTLENCLLHHCCWVYWIDWDRAVLSVVWGYLSSLTAVRLYSALRRWRRSCYCMIGIVLIWPLQSLQCPPATFCCFWTWRVQISFFCRSSQGNHLLTVQQWTSALVLSERSHLDFVNTDDVLYLCLRILFWRAISWTIACRLWALTSAACACAVDACFILLHNHSCWWVGHDWLQL